MKTMTNGRAPGYSNGGKAMPYLPCRENARRAAAARTAVRKHWQRKRRYRNILASSARDVHMRAWAVHPV